MDAPAGFAVGAAALCWPHDDAREAKSLRVDLPALVTREGADGSVERRELDVELQVGRTEPPSPVKLVQSFLDLPHQLRAIVLPHVEQVLLGFVQKVVPAPRITSQVPWQRSEFFWRCGRGASPARCNFLAAGASFLAIV